MEMALGVTDQEMAVAEATAMEAQVELTGKVVTLPLCSAPCGFTPNE
jgi:hypothetical protein